MTIRPALEQDYEVIAALIINELGYTEQKRDDIYNRMRILKRAAITTHWSHVSMVKLLDSLGYAKLFHTRRMNMSGY